MAGKMNADIRYSEWVALKPGAPVGARMWYAMIRKKITIEELCKKLFLSRSTIHAMIRGDRNVTTYNAINVCRELGVSLDWLMGESEEGGPNNV